ncbi:MAG: DNA primase, partial [Archaeoglobaceae archaeon]
VRKNTARLYEELKKEYKEIRIIFSGRGFHIHVLDSKAASLSQDERKELSERFSDFGIDEWVTSGEMRLIRLPFSLNALVSRVCVPLSIEDLKSFDPRFKAKPTFSSW